MIERLKGLVPVNQMHALLIGINNYKAEKLKNYSLHGCLNDVQRMSDLLTQMFGERLRSKVLTEGDATKAGILSAFRETLILPARLWSESGRPEPAPAFLFHFSGHGSQARDLTGSKPSGFDETLVPFDSRQADIFDLRDWELGALIDELGQYTTNITIVLDCCHAGSGTRSTGRAIEPDLRIPSDQSVDMFRGVSGRGLRSQPEIRMADYVLIAACDATQIAQEYHEQIGGTPKIYGAMTYALTEILGHASVKRMTYRDLHACLCAKVQSWYPTQLPQCEGDRDRWLFETGRAVRELPFQIVVSTEQDCTIDGGLVHGFAMGDELEVFSGETYALQGSEEVMGRLRIRQAGTVTSLCEYVSGNRPAIPGSRVRLMDNQEPQHEDHSGEGHGERATGKAWQRKVLKIRNHQSSILTGRVSCEIKVAAVGASSSNNGVPEYQVMAAGPDDLRRIVSGTSVCFSVGNYTDRPLYIQILSLGYDGSVSRIWPRLGGEQVALSAGRTFDTQRFRLKFDPRDTATLLAVEHVKVFASTIPLDVDMLCTGNRVHGTFGIVEADWTTVELEYQIIRTANAS